MFFFSFQNPCPLFDKHIQHELDHQALSGDPYAILGCLECVKSNTCARKQVTDGIEPMLCIWLETSHRETPVKMKKKKYAVLTNILFSKIPAGIITLQVVVQVIQSS